MYKNNFFIKIYNLIITNLYYYEYLLLRIFIITNIYYYEFYYYESYYESYYYESYSHNNIDC